jgi:hypothetical protein
LPVLPLILEPRIRKYIVIAPLGDVIWPSDSSCQYQSGYLVLDLNESTQGSLN